MKFSVLHSTCYRYTSPVWDSFNDAHLCPVSDDFQHCESFELRITPQSPSVLRRLDFYTNQVHYFEVTEAHESLLVEAHSVVETFEDTRDFSMSSSFGALSGLRRNECYYDFLAASPRVSLSTMIIHEARALVDTAGEVQTEVERITAFIHENFIYAPGSTQVESPLVEVLQQRRGVCQDFAHLMIAFCRVVGIPARYVSGYFYVATPVIGSVESNYASHAWVECYLPGIGWAGYDPTHNRRVSAYYIKVAAGRDYADVRPLAGTYRGQAVAAMDVWVRVSLI